VGKPRPLDDDLERGLDAARTGDARGFAVLFDALGAAVLGYLRVRKVSDPDGLTNEVFARAFRTIHTFRGDVARFRAWLFTIARNAAIDDARRRERRVREVPLDHAPEPVTGDLEAEVLEHHDADERVRSLLAQLSDDQREVIALRVLADLSVAQTAAVTDKSYEAVKALQRRGLAALRRALAAEQPVPR
jgi:RNA polymerase sigma-70 factor (ECF subfamily)